VCVLNDKIINIIYACVFYVNIEICIYHIALKNINILQIYLYNINIYSKLGLCEFQVRFNNIHTILITH
jgi:hypothetical protein